MKRRTWAMAAGGLTLAFGLAAGLWSLYPQNRNTLTALYEQAAQATGLKEAPPAAAPQAPRFVTAGFGDHAALSFHPGTSASFCDGTAGTALRLTYALALAGDHEKESLLASPRIGGDIELYNTLRRQEAAAVVDQLWAQTAVMMDRNGALDLAVPENTILLQDWLAQTAAEIERQTGLQVAFFINTATAIDRPRALDCAINAPAAHPL